MATKGPNKKKHMPHSNLKGWENYLAHGNSVVWSKYLPQLHPCINMVPSMDHTMLPKMHKHNQIPCCKQKKSKQNKCKLISHIKLKKNEETPQKPNILQAVGLHSCIRMGIRMDSKVDPQTQCGIASQQCMIMFRENCAECCPLPSPFSLLPFSLLP